MTTKKPSLTKQIAEVLGTEDKREQLKMVQDMVRQGGVPTVAVTVLFSEGEVEIALAGDTRLSAGNIKGILSLAIDDITAQVVRAELAQEAEAGIGLPEEMEMPDPDEEG